MALCFELVVNFGENAEAAREAALTLPDPLTLRAGRHRIPLHRMAPHRTSPAPGISYIELPVIPVAVGFGVGPDGTLPRTKLSVAELTGLGNELYRLLAKFDGYVAAKVGWDPEGFLEPPELGDLAEDLAEGSVDGLVLCEAVYGELGLGSNYVEFQPGYLWIPYEGEKRGTRH